MPAYKTFPDGLYPESGPVTIRQLKDWLAQFPDKRENGEDCEVWIETASSLSSGCSGLSSLNWDGSAGDVMLMLPE